MMVGFPLPYVIGLVWSMEFNAHFNNSSIISWRSVLLVEETPRINVMNLSVNVMHLSVNVMNLSVNEMILSVNEMKNKKYCIARLVAKSYWKILETEAILIPVTYLCMTALSLSWLFIKSAYVKSSLAEIIGHGSVNHMSVKCQPSHIMI